MKPEMKERLIQLPKFADARGWSLNGIYDMFEGEEFQINYSILYPGVVKAWHRHQHQDDYFCVLNGMAQVGIVNEHGGTKYFIGEHNPAVVHVKAGEWHGLTCVGNEPCGLLYLVTKKYDHESPDEERCPFDKYVGKDWWLPENK
jgi:dTDP-4-dehydrorhamnose 3,5-epimerase